jgi:hypothetical protein
MAKGKRFYNFPVKCAQGPYLIDLPIVCCGSVITHVIAWPVSKRHKGIGLMKELTKLLFELQLITLLNTYPIYAFW